MSNDSYVVVFANRSLGCGHVQKDFFSDVSDNKIEMLFIKEKKFVNDLDRSSLRTP